MSAAGGVLGDGRAIDHHPEAWLVVPTLSLLFGQALASFVGPIPPVAFAVLLASTLLLLALRSWRRRAILLSIAVIALSVGYLRHRALLYPSFADIHVRTVMARDDTLYLEGVLRHEPETWSERTRWQIRAERIWHPTGAEEVTGDVLVRLRWVRRDWHYGDRVRLRLRVQAPKDSGNPGGFNYATYLARREIYAMAFLDSDKDVELLAREAGLLRGFIEDLRRQIRNFMDRKLDPENGALIKALVLGDMGGISKETRDAFTAAGVNHVLSISGLHVAMLGLVAFVFIRHGLSLSAYLLLRFNLLKVAIFFSFLAVVFYTALAGAMVPTVRSAIMIGVYQLAVLLDREEEVFTSLTLAALLIASVWPGVIADISFQLSFFAVLFLVWGTRRIRDWFPRPKSVELEQEKSWLNERVRRGAMHLVVPLLATLGTAPLVAHYFGHLSFAGLIANPVIVPLVGFLVVPVGLAIGFCAVVLPGAAPPLVWIVEKLASLTIWLVQRLAQLPLANLSVPAPSPLEVLLLYVLIMSFFAARGKRQLAIALSVALGLLALDGAYWWLERWQRDDLRITYLNVGQGDAAVVELPRGKVLVIDAGGAAAGNFDTGEAIVAPFLRSRKILKVDYLFVSHARIGHYGGMRAIVAEFAPAEFWSGRAKAHAGRFGKLAEALEQARTPRLTLHAGEACRVIERVRLCVLHPLPEQGSDAPVVLRLEFGKARLLFASDVDRRAEILLAQRPAELRSSVVKIPRHGSAAANSKEFIAAVQPRLAILSAAARRGSDPRREAVVNRYRQVGAEVLRTYIDGAVIIETDGKKIRYSGYKSGKQGEIVL